MNLNAGKILQFIFGVTTLMVLTACSHDAPSDPVDISAEQSQYQPPPQVRNATYVWSAEPGIDLLDERGRLIRAAYEAMIISSYGGLHITYPGFVDALDLEFALGIGTRSDQSLAGTARAHILQINETDAGFKATVCSQLSRLAIRWPDGDYRISNFSGMEEYVEFDHVVYDAHNPRIDPRSALEHRWPASQSAEPTSDDGKPIDGPQWSAPTEDLFSGTGWTITFGADLGETMHRCEDWGRSIEPNVPDEGSETIRSPIPPKTLPAYPGW
ncbi:hypothetical protein [Rhodococcus artemisiae]|uniref:Lipoprotein n=1 Tax=Rhodococcus artemisiae TaxID=714159 RepID=A0ABU7L8X4_9NOCA|nr:hypothetical protein [Rhodococcus artemisiae]MEE2057995.1 hypothetical protein [Rhodococcus artemisiae]